MSLSRIGFIHRFRFGVWHIVLVSELGQFVIWVELRTWLVNQMCVFGFAFAFDSNRIYEWLTTTPRIFWAIQVLGICEGLWLDTMWMVWTDLLRLNSQSGRDIVGWLSVYQPWQCTILPFMVRTFEIGWFAVWHGLMNEPITLYHNLIIPNRYLSPCWCSSDNRIGKSLQFHKQPINYRYYNL